MIEFGATCAYRFFKKEYKIIATHHKSRKSEEIPFKFLSKIATRGNSSDAIYTNLVKQYIGHRWQHAFYWAGWAKKRLYISMDYRLIAMTFLDDEIVENSRQSPALAKYQITFLVNSGTMPSLENYNWLRSIKYPVMLFTKPPELSIEVLNLYHYRVAVAMKMLSLYEYESELNWLIINQDTIRFKSREDVYRWMGIVSNLRREENASYIPF
jgi:hypothetical protein